jgi:hypothetical protein
MIGVPDFRQSAATIDERRRLAIPKDILSHIRWMSEVPETIETLAVLALPGFAQLLPLSVWTERILPVKRELESRAGEAAADADLFLMTDRYKLLSFSRKEARLTMPPEMSLHLEIVSLPQLVYLETHGKDLRVLSVGYRNSRALIGSAFLNGLP